jgi:3-hydroxy-9,10-secoandrosta-1,3,5(10)-triene-9,17-dione monooxygenase reductase component
VNFLADDAEGIAHICASKGEDKFAGVSWKPAVKAHGAPILTDHITAYAECAVHTLMDAGDHWVVLATVDEGLELPGRDPLVHARGRLAQLEKGGARAT